MQDALVQRNWVKAAPGLRHRHSHRHRNIVLILYGDRHITTRSFMANTIVGIGYLGR
jgi:hypothetical protein